MNNDYQILKPLITNWVHDETEKKFRNKVVQVHLSASSFVRKPYTICRVKNLISKHKLDLKVFEEESMLKNDRFVISKK